MLAIMALTWVVMGALGAIFCGWVLGGPPLLRAIKPTSSKAALWLLAACTIGALGGVVAGVLMRLVNNAAQDAGDPTAGAIVGILLGLFLFPFATYGIFHYLEYRLGERARDPMGAPSGFLKAAGCLIILVVPLGMVVMGNVGYDLGAGSFVLASVLAPFAAATVLLIAPTLIWLALKHDGEWLQVDSAGGALSGRQRIGWDAGMARRSSMARRGSIGRRRW